MDILKIGSTVIGTVLNVKNYPIAQKVLLTALDGTAYAQTPGQAIQKYKVDCYCPTGEARAALDEACNNCDIVTIVRDSQAFSEGYIEEKTISWKEWKDGHGISKFTLVQK